MHRVNFKNISFVFLLLYFILSVYFVMTNEEDHRYDPVNPPTTSQPIDMRSIAGGLRDSNLLADFPYMAYLQNAEFRGVDQLQRDIKQLDSLFPSFHMAGQQVVAEAMTNQWRQRDSAIFGRHSFDTLLLYFKWAESFRYYAAVDITNATCYDVIYNYWMNEIANNLSNLQKADNGIKYNTQFQYLQKRLAENTYLVNIKESKVEKFLKNLRAGNWSHLIQATWSDASLGLKAAMILLGIGTLAAYIALFNAFRIYLKKRHG